MNGTPVITSIKVNSYESKKINVEKLASHLIGLKCSNTGHIHLKLSSGWQLSQKGAIIKPPIRWLHSFERNASFDIECNITNDDVPNMQNCNLRQEYQPDGESIIFFWDNPENTECVS